MAKANVAPSGILTKTYYRNGDNHRAGADVTFQDVRKVFGFRSIEIGRWVTREEQQRAANLFFDALCDLADLLCVPTPVISLNGTLSLAFGKGGNRYASAHYNSSNGQLALAKNAGGGALAHEWFHAFDHYIASRAFENATPLSFASQLWLTEGKAIDHPLNQHLFTFFKTIMLSPNGAQTSDYVQRAVRIDKAMSSFYFAQPAELAARAFECVLQHQKIKNHFLVAGTKQSAEAELGAYLTPSEIQDASPAVFHYFDLLGQAVNAKHNVG